MEDITQQALDMVFNNDTLKSKVRRQATPYVAGVAAFNIIILIGIVFLIFQVASLNQKLRDLALR
jgi:hypothetical protein